MGFLDFAKQKPRLLLLGVIVASALAVGFTYTKVFTFSASGGSLSPYLLGYYDLRTDDCIGAACADNNEDSQRQADAAGILTNRTDVAIDLSNPTTTVLRALISVFDDAGTHIGCTTTTLEANDTDRVYVNNDIFKLNNGPNGDGKFGVIKVVTFLDSDLTKVQAGVKGWLTHYVTESSDQGHQLIFTRQSQMQQVPVEVLKNDKNAELAKIAASCL
jgi:hypothetical protein